MASPLSTTIADKNGNAVTIPVAGTDTNGNPITALAPYVNAALITETALTATGSTTARGLTTAGYSKASYQVDVTNIGTNVVVRLEGSNDGTGWANLSGDQTYTANGTYMLSTDGIAAGYVRLTLASLSGGTPSVTAKLLRAN